jgi:hypothetical protein
MFRKAPVFLRILAGNASAKMPQASWAIVFAYAIDDVATFDDLVSYDEPRRSHLSRFVTVVLAVRDQPLLCFHLLWNHRWPESHSFRSLFVAKTDFIQTQNAFFSICLFVGGSDLNWCSEDHLEKRKALFGQALEYLNTGEIEIDDLFTLMDDSSLLAVFSEHLPPAL